GRQQERIWNWCLVLASLCSIAILASAWFARHDLFLVDTYYAAMAWLIAGLVWLTGRRIEAGAQRSGWKLLGTAWAFMGTLIWIAVSYSQNRSGSFHAGLVICLALLIFCKFVFRMPGPV